MFVFFLFSFGAMIVGHYVPDLFEAEADVGQEIIDPGSVIAQAGVITSRHGSGHVLTSTIKTPAWSSGGRSSGARAG